MTDSISIPGYRVVRKLGQGGMATVYLAIQESFDRDVALKVMSPFLNSDPTFATRFLREARIVAQIHHSSIVPVMDVGQHEGHHYLCMEYLPGGDLKERIVAGRHGVSLALNVCVAISSALDLAHRKGFVHRDIKPENILFREDGTPVLTDFGIARAIDTGTQLTMAGTMVGTPNYMSPEQVKGGELDGRSDLYSMGVVFYEMLTGLLPFTAESTMHLAIKHLSEPLPHLPPELAVYQAFLDRLMAKDRDDRFATGAEVIRALRLITDMAAKREATLVRPPLPYTGSSDPTMVSPTSPPQRAPTGAQSVGTVRIPSTATQPSGIMQIPKYNNTRTQPPAPVPAPESTDATLIHPGLPTPPPPAAATPTVIDPDATATRTKVKPSPPPTPPRAPRKPSAFETRARQMALLAVTKVQTAPTWALVTVIAIVTIGMGYLIGKLASPGPTLPEERSPQTRVEPNETAPIPTPDPLKAKSGDLIEGGPVQPVSDEAAATDVPAEEVAANDLDPKELERKAKLDAEREARQEAANKIKQETLKRLKELELKRQAAIRDQLAAAKIDFAEGRIWRPIGGSNALARYREVIFLDPKNLDAIAALSQISDILAKEARNALTATDAEQARWFIDQIRDIRPDHPELPLLNERLAKVEAGEARLDRTALRDGKKAVDRANSLLDRVPPTAANVIDASRQLQIADEKAAQGVEELRRRFPSSIERAAIAEMERGKPKNVQSLITLARTNDWMGPKLEELERSLNQ